MKIGEEFMKKAFLGLLPYADCPRRICDILNIDDGVVSFL